jgi:hypothetical protein
VKVKYIRGTPRTHELILSTAASYRNVTDTSIAERLRPDDFCYVNRIRLKDYLDFNDDCHSLLRIFSTLTLALYEVCVCSNKYYCFL